MAAARQQSSTFNDSDMTGTCVVITGASSGVGRSGAGFSPDGRNCDPEQDAAPRKQFGTTCIVLRLGLIPRRQVMGSELAEGNLNQRAKRPTK